MTRDEVIKLAEENGIVIVGEAMFRFAALVAAHEREECARICFQESPSIDGELIAEAIRARGEK